MRSCELLVWGRDPGPLTLDFLKVANYSLGMRGEPKGSVPLTNILKLKEALARYEAAERQAAVAKQDLDALVPGAFAALRAANGINQSSLARALKRDPQYVNQVESGKLTPSSGSLTAFLNLTVTQEALAGTSGKDCNGNTDEGAKEEEAGDSSQ